MARNDDFLTVRIPTEELIAFRQYCKRKNQTQTDLVRGFIRAVIAESDWTPLRPGENPVEPKPVTFLRATVEVKDPFGE